MWYIDAIYRYNKDSNINITRDSLHYVTSPHLDITNYESKVHSTKSIVLNQMGVCI